jgi:LysR family transcriptional regulator, glycine cleavage system transcriptional activator
MSRRLPLPPLQPLVAFEAVARHLSFSRAADELCITQSAVSHQIRHLEEHFGLKLFYRMNPGIALTEDGQALLPDVRDALDRLTGAAERLRRRARAGVLSVGAPPGMATWWLVPRLGRFSARHPEIEVRIVASDEKVDFDRDRIDLCLFLARPETVSEGPTACGLLRERVFPVCSPKLAESVRGPEDLARVGLLHEDQHYTPELDWGLWVQALGVSGKVDHRRGARFSHFALVMRAAADGMGVALGRSPLIDDELAAGRLVRPFGPVEMPASRIYAAAWPAGSNADPRVMAFRDWLKDECAPAPAAVTLGAT